MDDIPHDPQRLRSVRVGTGLAGQLASHPDVKAAVEAVEADLGAHGRVNLRPSGTEPLVRVMVEGEDADQVERLAERLAATVEQVGAAAPGDVA